MLRYVALILAPIFLLAAACGGGSSDDGAVADNDSDAPVEVSDAGPDGIYNTDDDAVVGDEPDLDDEADDSIVGTDPDADTGSDDDGVTSVTDDDDSVVNTTGDGDNVTDDDAVISDIDFGLGDSDLNDNALLGAMDPFTLLGGMGAVPLGQADIDPELAAVLLNAGDLPASYQDLGSFSLSTPTEYGDVSMAATMFGTSSNPEEFGAMVMSAVMTLPPEALGDLDELTALTEADLQELQGETGEFGDQFSISLLNVDGLGDQGFGMHMEIDFGELFALFGAPEDDSMPAGIAMDMYAFAAGDRLLMVMVMWPTGESPGVDGRALAEIMDSRA